MTDAKLSSRLSGVSLIFACGTALFSDGYANGVLSDVNVLLSRVYPNEIASTNYATVVSSLAFAGTVVGQECLSFGVLSDKVGRKFGMMSATAIVAFFSLLSAASEGAHHSASGTLAMLSACRFLLGIGVGAEYPCGSVSASEQTEQKSISKNAQHRWFALATSTFHPLEIGFLLTSSFLRRYDRYWLCLFSFVPLVVVYWIFGPNHLHAVWRISLGLGFVPAMLVFIWRLNMLEPDSYRKSSMRNIKIPYGLVLRRYWPSLVAISLTWFIYDFITFVNFLSPYFDGAKANFGFTVIHLFYIPGAFGGAFIVDYLGPKYTMITGLLCQAVIGFIMSGLYQQLTSHVVYGIFLSFGELGPGNCLGLLASKTSPTAVRGQFYGVAAAIGKIGAFVGTWAFPPMIKAFGGASTARGNTGPFWVGSGLAILSALITFFFIRPLSHDGMADEDEKFREYLEANGFDTSGMGLRETSSTTVVSDVEIEEEKAEKDSV
ncbi:putative metabolite transporter [Gymnopus androsaceus JB14]|uniref:Metabolite transporter n=1 Tax=Gymnopus androsaceus JB14 TaxID=1447944 RepID=A0A6A4HUM2_9AGAR|nr:putative metabolite transporter [Gymnopus androsaceus JB14]